MFLGKNAFLRVARLCPESHDDARNFPPHGDGWSGNRYPAPCLYEAGFTMSVALPPLMASVKVQLPTASGLNSNVSPACM